MLVAPNVVVIISTAFRFMHSNPLTTDTYRNRRFQDEYLPYPNIIKQPSLPSTLPFQPPAKPASPAFAKPPPSPIAAPSLEEQLRAASTSPSVAIQPLPPPEKQARVDSTTTPKPISPSLPPSDQPSLAAHAPPVDDQAASQVSHSISPPLPVSVNPTESHTEDQPDQALPVPDGPSVDPKAVIPPSTEEVATPSQALSEQQEKDDATKPPQVVHLPPIQVQEAKLQETERKLEKAAEKERKEDEKLALPNPASSTDQVSSPSSTVGPYSQATPHAPHHSPDTSPETDSFQDRVPPQSQVGGAQDPASQLAKDDHERVLQEQMREAREKARAESPGKDDVEKQLEDEQAIRMERDGKGRLNEPESALPTGPEALTNHAVDVVREVQVESTNDSARITNEEPAVDSLPTPTTTAPEPSTEATENAEKDNTKPDPPAKAPEHPTPPAEIDVDTEMNDAPPPADENPVPPTPPRQDRMTTRVSSGALRQKSVSELIAEKSEQSGPKSALTPRSSNLSTSTSPAHPARDRKRKSISTVVFAKPDLNKAAKALQLFNEDYASLQGASEDSTRDYLQGLFQFQAHNPPRSKPLQELVNSAQKTLSTAGTLAMIREQQDYKILKRVYQLQNANRWSLRQLQKSTEPERPITHQDHLLAEMKWMQTDFREERKWKKALAATFAEWCAEYFHSNAEERQSLRVKARIPQSAQQRVGSADEDMNDAPTPDLIHSGANETESESFPDDEELHSPLTSSIPAGLFSLGFNEVVMKIDRTPASDSLFQELPWYEPMLEGAADVTPLSFVDPPILPVSKFVTGKLVSQVRGPPRKRSRYEYDSEDESSSPPSRSGTSAEHSMPSTPGRRLFHRNDLLPELNDVALFNSENRRTRDRLQAAYQFRPPTEFPMPPVSFFENRNSSQWLWDEDQKLRAYVKEYTFNWSLVAQQLALPSLFTSSSGRRTPWECFERWVQLEGLPAEMSKTPYFRTYQSRLEQAQKTVLAQLQAQQQLQQQQQQNGQNVSTGQPRRRTTQPIRVERRRDNRHLAIIDGMRKLARKRESQLHKQTEAAKAAQLRKQHDPVQPKNNIQTPQEFSRLKWEREEKFKQRQILMQQEMMQKVSISLYYSSWNRLTIHSSKWQHVSNKCSKLRKPAWLTE